MNTKQAFMYGSIALIIIAFTALSLIGCPDPDPGDKLKTLSGTIIISPSSGVTVNTELTATYSGTETVTYQWKQGAANVGTNSTTYTPTAAGSYTVTVSTAGYQSKTSAAVTVTNPNPLTGISAVYNSSNPIFPDTTLHTLKDGLTVTATYSDNSTKTLEMEDYTLSGTLAQGSSVITVSYTESGITKTDTFNVTVHAAHNHIWGNNWEETTPPTCTEPGVDTRNCTADPPHSESRTGTAALGHDAGEWHVTLPATCEETGIKELRCTRDQFVLQDNVTVDAIGHDWGEWGTPVPATETEDGFKTRVCKRNDSHTDTEFSGEYAIGTAGLDFQLIDNNTAYRVSKGTTAGAIHIPAYYRPNSSSQYLPVTVLGNGNTNDFGTVVTSITFAENSQLTTISDRAFDECTYLTSIVIPASVTSIGEQAFINCTSLTNITIPASVTTIGNGAFQQCTSLASIMVDNSNPNYASENGILYNKAKTSILIVPPGISGSVIIPASVTAIGQLAFWLCESLTTVTFAEGSQLTTIGNNAFASCKSLASITIPANVTTIGQNAFSQCTSLISLNFAENSQLTTINEFAFSYCTNLTSVTIPASVTTIDSSVFRNCTGLVTVTFAENSQLVTIGDSAFASCEDLTSITIPANVTSIGRQAFYDCTSLISITIPASVTSISVGAFSAFSGCTSLTDITVDANNPNYASQDGILYNKTKTEVILILPGISGSITIPASVTSIGQTASSNCTGLTAVTFASGSQLASIGNYAFRGCTSLTEITIPAGVTSIGNNAFSGCTGLADINIPANVTSIGDSAFSGCTGLTEITIPASVMNIGEEAFGEWTAAQTVYVRGYASQTTADAAWGGQFGWRRSCNAIIKYWNGSSYQ